MAVNNPFIHYKLYSTPTEIPENNSSVMDNVRIICLITADDSEMHSFLQKILEAAKIMSSDYHIITLDRGSSLIASDQHWYGHSDTIFLFDIPAATIGVQIQHRLYTRADIDGKKFIQLPGLKKIESDKNEKSKLWQFLKKEIIHE